MEIHRWKKKPLVKVINTDGKNRSFDVGKKKNIVGDIRRHSTTSIGNYSEKKEYLVPKQYIPTMDVCQ